MKRAAGTALSVIVVLFDHHESLRNHRDTSTLEQYPILWLEQRRLPPNQGFCEGSLLRNEPQYPMGYALHSGRGGVQLPSVYSDSVTHRAPKAGECGDRC